MDGSTMVRAQLTESEKLARCRVALMEIELTTVTGDLAEHIKRVRDLATQTLRETGR